MRRLALWPCIALLTSVSHAAEAPASDADTIRAHVEFLADDLLEGRATGTRGYDIAARYVASQMQAIGLEPAGDGGGWLQAVPLIQATRDHGAASFSIHRAGGEDRLAPLDDFIAGFHFSQAESSLTAPAVYVGYGVYAPELGHDDFAGMDLRGKIAVALSGAPARFPNSQRAHYSSRSKIEGLVARGAIGFVSLDTPEEEQRSPWSRAKQLSWNPRMRLTDAAGQPVDSYPEIRVAATLSVAAAPRLFAGAAASADEAFAAARAGRFLSFDLPGELSIAHANRIETLGSSNVVGLLRGNDPALAAEYIVITAHLDHIGRGAAVNGDDIYNGALDNASGVAVLLEAARSLGSSVERPRRSILFVALTAEERGLLGAYHFAAHPPVPQQSLIANINNDMPIALFPLAGMSPYGAEHSTLGASARAALADAGFAEVPDTAPEEVVFVRSDQYPFVRAGIPAIFLVAGRSSSDPSVDATAVFRRFLLENYHAPSDSTALPIHWPSLARIADANVQLALAIANAEDRPRWLPGEFFGETFGRNRD